MRQLDHGSRTYWQTNMMSTEKWYANMRRPRRPAYLDLVDTIGERVKRARNSIQMTQNELAGRLGLSQGYISAVENGRDKANVEILVGLVMFFPDISPDWLLTGRGGMRQPNEADSHTPKYMLDTKVIGQILTIFDRILAEQPEDTKDRYYSSEHHIIGLLYRTYMAHYDAFLAQGLSDDDARSRALTECERLDQPSASTPDSAPIPPISGARFP